MKTFVKELKSVKLRKPTMLEGFPGLGYIGKISIGYLVKQLNAKKLAELYSPFFPNHVLTNSRGSARLPRADFYFWQNPKEEADLVFLTSDAQAQSIEGQYEVVDTFLGYAKQIEVQHVVAIGGYSAKIEDKSAKVACASTSRKLLDDVLKAGAEISPIGNPIVGLAGLTLGLAKFREIDATSILGETAGHMPDPTASKNVLAVIQRFLGLDLDLEPLDAEIEKALKAFKKMEDAQQKMDEFVKKSLESESRKLTYIT